jgi:GNAT superfamily N-acetyltransferase|tara:strand:+ start:6296 stop:6778 length:483 start_codon:yes stop_codon:yes gene_type:complete
MDIIIRKGLKKDLPDVLHLIKELADYENSLEQVNISLDQLEKDGFGSHPYFFFLVAINKNEIIGMSFYHIRYSTWKGKFLFLEDFVVKESFRKQGIGSKLFEATINEANHKNLNGMFWQVLDWNTPAINFYKKYKSDISSKWLNGKLNKEQLLSIKSMKI